jgi:ribosomal protein S24E
MSDRILAVEKKMELGNRISKEYLSIVQDCELMRMIYAKYNLKRNDELLLLIKEKLIHIKQKELKLLGDFILEIESEEN